MEILALLTVIGLLGILSYIWWVVKSLLLARLHEAVKADNYDKVLRLINKGADVNRISPRHGEYGGYAPLHLADSARVAKLLIERGANPNILSAHAWTPLYLCCDFYNKGDLCFEVIEVLIDAGAKMGFSTGTIDDPREIEKALVKANRIDLICKLIDNGSNMPKKMKSKYTGSPLDDESDSTVSTTKRVDAGARKSHLDTRVSTPLKRMNISEEQKEALRQKSTR